MAVLLGVLKTLGKDGFRHFFCCFVGFFVCFFCGFFVCFKISLFINEDNLECESRYLRSDGTFVT